MERKVFFGNGKGVKLAGVLHLPESRTCPAVVLCHGFMSRKERQEALARELARKGFAVLRFDFFGHGESGGSFEDVSVSEEVRDLEKALDFMETLDCVDRGRMGVAGSSLGGMVAILAAAGDKRIRALSLKGPACDLKEISLRLHGKAGIEKWERDGVTVRTSLVSGKKFKIKYRYYLDALRHNVYKAARSVECPAIIFHGKEDSIVPFAQAEKLAKSLRNSVLKPLPGAGHMPEWKREETEAVNRKCAEWFCKVLGRFRDF
jgi:hypothetical protein